MEQVNQSLFIEADQYQSAVLFAVPSHAADDKSPVLPDANPAPEAVRAPHLVPESSLKSRFYRLFCGVMSVK